MGFVGNYAPHGLSPQMYDMPVIPKKPPLILHGQGAAYYLMQFRIIRRRALLREPQLQEPLSQGPL